MKLALTLLLAAVTILAGQGPPAAGPPTERTKLEADIHEMAVISMFLEHWRWNRSASRRAGAMGCCGGLSDEDSKAFDGIAAALRGEEDAVQRDAEKDRKQGRNRANFERKRTVLLSARKRFQDGLSAEGWQKVRLALDDLGRRLPSARPGGPGSAR